MAAASSSNNAKLLQLCEVARAEAERFKRAAPSSSSAPPPSDDRNVNGGDDDDREGGVTVPYKKSKTGKVLLPWKQSEWVRLGLKRMTATDVSSYANRFLFSREMARLLKWKVLDGGELERINSDEGLSVRVVDRKARMFETVLKVWPSNDWVVLRGKEYIKFVEDNGLGQHDEVDIWVFRLLRGPRRVLCFPIVARAPSMTRP
ncbi:hypothetical protein H6P81_001344 [Aristolochia fimbriata]|uniref:Uncharacterized protein n=1 Tax=Aristolochia fimbriata TaxID=158543 RepID=A0AAV7F9U1_ARIFI|nr:hypothetical protein H6P81_001344 [Aristolochia fimbriata]